MTNLLELRWEVDTEGYDVLDGEGKNADTLSSILKRALLEDDSAHIVSRGGLPRSYKCKGDDLRVLRDLLNEPATPGGMLGFVKQWGLLAPPSDHGLQLLSTFIVLQEALAEIYRKGPFPYAGEQVVAKLDLICGPTGAFSLRANTLVEFLWAQVTLQQRRGAIYQCPTCMTFALRTTSRRSRKPKKKLGRMPEYCSNACKMKSYRQSRKAAGE